MDERAAELDRSEPIIRPCAGTRSVSWQARLANSAPTYRRERTKHCCFPQLAEALPLRV